MRRQFGRELYPCGRQSRRGFLHQAGGGFLGLALGGLWAEAGDLGDARLEPQFAPRVKSVIFLFMCGGVSHIDTFDPKGNKWAGKLIDVIGFGDNLAEMKRPVIPCLRTFTRYGQSGIPVSDWFPHIGSVIDEIAVVRSMWCKESNHFTAVTETTTGHMGRRFDYPCFGSWVVHALGSANRNLPTFVNIGRPTSPVQLTGGFFGASDAGTPFQPGDTPIPNLKPPAGTARERERQMQALEELNGEFRERYAINSEIAARMRAYELAARMQLAAPRIVDFSNEPETVLDLYGLGASETDGFGRQLLLARRLAEQGVRFIQVCHAGNGSNGRWDAHDDIKSHEPLCRETDRPIAGLIRDLKQRGMLDETLVVWSSEFGRSPWSQNTTGRDHNPCGYTVWLAGGGIKGGTVHGATDEFGFKAVEDRHYYSDLHATILHQLGLDYKKMQIEVRGVTQKLVEEGDGPIGEIIGKHTAG